MKKQLTEQLILFKTAKLAKEIGFDLSIVKYGYFYAPIPDEEGNLSVSEKELLPPNTDDYVPAPTQSLLQKWLREKYNIHVEPYVILGDTNLYGYEINNKRYIGVRFFKYEHSLEKGLFQALKLIKS